MSDTDIYLDERNAAVRVMNAVRLNGQPAAGLEVVRWIESAMRQRTGVDVEGLLSEEDAREKSVRDLAGAEAIAVGTKLKRRADLQAELTSASDHRDWDRCNVLEKEIEVLNVELAALGVKA